jgi:hypothetical protein
MSIVEECHARLLEGIEALRKELTRLEVKPVLRRRVERLERHYATNHGNGLDFTPADLIAAGKVMEKWLAAGDIDAAEAVRRGIVPAEGAGKSTVEELAKEVKEFRDYMAQKYPSAYGNKG